MAETSLNSLQAGQSLGVCSASNNFRQLWSEDRKTRLSLQVDGNLVIYAGDALWSSGTVGLPLRTLLMRADGDLVLVDASGRIRWHSATSGHPGAHCVLQNDSNLVIYARGVGGNEAGAGALWSTGTGHGEGGFFGAVGSVIGTAAGAVNSVGDLIGSVPVIGKPFEAVYGLTFAEPFEIASGIANGDRLDRVALGSIERQVDDIRTLAPYVQMIIAEVPGIGTGISAGIGAGLALAAGQTIDQAVLAAARGALPGGAVAGALFDVGASVLHSAVTGQPLSGALLAAGTSLLPLSAPLKEGLSMALQIGAQVAAHKAIDVASLASAALSAVKGALPASASASITAAIGAHDFGAVADIIVQQTTKSLPASATRALQVGLSLGQAQGLQELHTTHATTTAPPLDLSGLAGLKISFSLPSAQKSDVHFGPLPPLNLSGFLKQSEFDFSRATLAEDKKVQAEIADARVKAQIAAARTKAAAAAPSPHSTRNRLLVGAGAVALVAAKFLL